VGGEGVGSGGGGRKEGRMEIRNNCGKIVPKAFLYGSYRKAFGGSGDGCGMFLAMVVIFLVARVRDVWRTA
jgi:hypothetical protein